MCQTSVASMLEGNLLREEHGTKHGFTLEIIAVGKLVVVILIVMMI